jgi:D-3-phosphoglycerate dehydrogenase
MKVLISDKLDENSINQIKDAGVDVTVKTGMTPDELKATIPEFDVIVIRSATKVKADILDAATNLKLVVRAGVGLDNVDIEHAKTKNVEVKNTPGVTTISVAEHTIGLMLALARNVPQACASIKDGKWDRKKYGGTELLDKTLGLIGFGRIGHEVANRAKAFGMNVIAFDPIMEAKDVEKFGAKNVELNELFETADYISLHVPLNEKTKHMINAEAISKMKRGTRIINCARGGTIDETALATAIKEGHIAGAAFDVYESEPPGKENPLVELEQFIGVPHLGASTAEGQARAGAEVAKIVIQFTK